MIRNRLSLPASVLSFDRQTRMCPCRFRSRSRDHRLCILACERPASRADNRRPNSNSRQDQMHLRFKSRPHHPVAQNSAFRSLSKICGHPQTDRTIPHYHRGLFAGYRLPVYRHQDRSLVSDSFTGFRQSVQTAVSVWFSLFECPGCLQVTLHPLGSLLQNQAWIVQFQPQCRHCPGEFQVDRHL